MSPPSSSSVSSIRALDSNSIHKICSGQVIVDLATAVKELVENALDAGATVLEVKLKEMGVESIEVSDNGMGIDQSNYEGLALKHHTSKLVEFSDLLNVNSFGFRGEALNALCELSGRFAVNTKKKEESVGNSLTFARNGTLISQKPVAASAGTTVIVENLFETLPVRRGEFIRSIKKQYQKLIKVLQSYAIISIGVKINVINFSKGKKEVVISTQSAQRMEDAVSTVFGSKFLASLMPISISLEPTIDIESPHDDKVAGAPPSQESDEAGGVAPTGCTESEAGSSDLPGTQPKSMSYACTIHGFVSKTGLGVGRSDNDRQFTFCNGRPVDLAKFNKAINDAWRRYEMKQKPAFILDIRVPAGTFDVNLTPDKREIVLTDEDIMLERLKSYLEDKYEPSRYTFLLSQGLSAGLAGAAQTNLFKYSFSVDPKDAVPAHEKAHRAEEEEEEDSVDETADEGNKGDDAASSEEHRSFAVDEDSTNSVSSREPPQPTIWLTDEQQESQDSHASAMSERSQAAGRGSPARGSPRKRLLVYEKGEEEEEAPAKKVGADGFLAALQEGEEEQGVEEGEEQGVEEEEEEEQGVEEGEGVKRDVALWSIDGPSVLQLLKESAQLVRSRSDRNAHLHPSPDAAELSLKNDCSITSDNAVRCERALSRVLNRNNFKEMRVIGQFNLGFIITEFDGDLFILDQHACDEKYKFETFQQSTVIHQQPLISPISLEASAAEEIVIMENISTFEDNGFKLSVDPAAPSGSRIKLLAVPFSKSTQFGIEDVHELASLLSDGLYGDGHDDSYQATKLTLTNHELTKNGRKNKVCLPKVIAMFASRACRSAVMIGKALTHAEMRVIVERLSELDQPWNCPHGRPTLRLCRAKI